MARPPLFTPEQVVEAVNACKGLVFLTARRLGCSAETVRNYAKRHASVREALSQNRGEMVDAAEGKLFQAAKNGEAWAVCFLLKCQAKDRGYVERTEHRHGGDKDAPPIAIKDESRAKWKKATVEELLLLRELHERVAARSAKSRAGEPASGREEPV